MLNNIEDFIEAFAAHSSRMHDTNSLAMKSYEVGDVYCPGCGGPRRIRLQLLSPVRVPRLIFDEVSAKAVARQLAPAVFVGACLQDHTRFTFVLFQGPSDFELAVFPTVRGGLATANTPSNVAYYLDQAQRCQSTAANSAAVAMYRAALEHLLYEQGFEVRMLGPKIEALNMAIEDGSAPRWALDLDPDFLTVIGRLGNAAIHPGDGDVDRQQALDAVLLTAIEVTFAELLHVIYEREHQQRGRLAALRGALAAVEGAPEAPADA